jgi:hypothetical protein
MKTRSRSLWQFSLRGLLIAAILVSPPLAWIGYLKRSGQRYRRAIAALKEDFEVDKGGHRPNTYMDFVEKYVDADAFSQAHFVTWKGQTTIRPELVQKLLDVQFMAFAACKRHQVPIGVSPGKIEWTDRELLLLAKSSSLQVLQLDGKYSTKAVQELCKPSLQVLTLPEVLLDDDLAMSLSNCKSLGSIGFNFQNTSQKQIELLASLPRLHAVSIHGLPDRPECLSSFSACKSITIFMIHNANLTPEASKSLSKVPIQNLQLINCTFEMGFFASFGDDAQSIQVTVGRTGQRTLNASATDPKLTELESK